MMPLLFAGRFNPIDTEYKNNENYVLDEEILLKLGKELSDKKKQINYFDPDICYTKPEKLEVNSIFDQNILSKHKSKSSQLTKAQIRKFSLSKKRASQVADAELSFEAKNIAEEHERKLESYKKNITAFDLIGIVFIFAGIFLAQYENEHYYFSNVDSRNITIHVVNNILRNEVTNFATYFGNYTNLTEQDCNYFPRIKVYNFSNFEEVGCSIIIDEYSSTLRLTLLITSLISIPFLILSKYYEYKRNHEYKNKIKGNKLLLITLLISLLILLLMLNSFL